MKTLFESSEQVHQQQGSWRWISTKKFEGPPHKCWSWERTVQSAPQLLMNKPSFANKQGISRKWTELSGNRLQNYANLTHSQKGAAFFQSLFSQATALPAPHLWFWLALVNSIQYPLLLVDYSYKICGRIAYVENLNSLKLFLQSWKQHETRPIANSTVKVSA